MIIVFCLVTRSSIDISYSSYPIDVLLSSPYLLRISMISSLMTSSNTLRSESILLNSAIFFWSSAYSLSIFSLSSPVRARSLISTIACACASLSENLPASFSLASAVLFDERIIDITSSILSRAINKPSKICALSSALLSSYFVRRVTTSSWCLR